MRRPSARIVVTGDEVLLGRVAERNGAYVAARLDALGVEVRETRIVADDLAGIVGALREAIAAGADLVVTSGGLGPTHDDRTMEAVAEVAGVPLAVDEELRGVVLAAHAGRTHAGVAESVAKQSALPLGGVALPPSGTAPGVVVRAGAAAIVVLPGPPWELSRMWEHALRSAPVRAVLDATAPPRRRTLRLFGVPESQLMGVRAELAPEAAAALHGIYTRAGELELVVDGDHPGARGLVDGVRAAFGALLYSDDGRGVDEVVADRLVARGERVAVAESCTGGGLGARITATPGSSAWFLGGVIAYDNAVKEALLGVDAALLARDGAVSEGCARAMADGVRAATGAEWGVSITGVAGPGGGTDEKPVGSVYVGVSGGGRTEAHRLRLPGDREAVRGRAVAHALHRLRVALS